MTKFTEPTSYPHECLTFSGVRATIVARAKNGATPYLVILHNANGTEYATIVSANTLRDLPKVEKAWVNDYSHQPGVFWHSHRIDAIKAGDNSRIGLIRREICDGKVTYHAEEI